MKKIFLYLACMVFLICSLVFAENATQTLRPNAAGTYSQAATSDAGDNYEMVDETPTDEDETYVYADTGAWKVDAYNFSSPGVQDSSNINSVTAYRRGRKYATGSPGGQPTMSVYLRTHGTDYPDPSTNQGLEASYQTYSNTYTVNPHTGQAWTWQEIDDIEVGIGLKGYQTGYGAGEGARCTQVWVEVDYTFIPRVIRY